MMEAQVAKPASFNDVLSDRITSYGSESNQDR